MKKTLLSATLLLALTLPYKANAKIADDKMMHSMAGLFVYGGCMLGKGIAEAVIGDEISWYNYKTCLIPVYAAGIGKELYDKRHPESHTAEFADTVATVAIPTAIAGSIVLYKW